MGGPDWHLHCEVAVVDSLDVAHGAHELDAPEGSYLPEGCPEAGAETVIDKQMT